MAKSSKGSSAGGSGGNGAAAAQLTEIRNLLFADAIAEIQQQMEAGFAAMEQRLSDTEQSLKQHVEQLGERVDQQVERLEQVLADENKKLSDAGDELKHELDSVGEDLKQTRHWVEAEHETLYGELADKHSAAISHVDAIAEAMENKKADREALAALFSTLVNQLSQEPLSERETGEQ